MTVHRFLAAAFAMLVLAGVSPVRAGNYEFNFNADSYASDGWGVVNFGTFSGTSAPWEWTGGASKSEGGWHTRSGPDGAGVGTFLVSPCFIVDGVGQDFVRVDLSHRFNFGGVSPTGTTPLLALGQAQYMINSGSWIGVPLQAFNDADTGTSGNVKPTYLGPTPAPPFDSGQLAWQGTTLNFAETTNHQPSAFQLAFTGSSFGVGSEIQFRFLMGPQTASASPPAINWEINSVNVKGVTLCPEPETLALAGIGCLGCLLFVGRRQRRSRSARKLSRSAAATILLAAAVAGLFAAAPAEAATSWNFQTNDGGWTRSHASPFLFPPDFRWTWTGTYSGTLPITGGTSPHWRVVAMGMQPPYSAGHFLTSPVFSGLSGTIPSQNARISIAHEFLYATGTSGLPINTGQLQYSVNGGPWAGLPLAAFTSGSSVLVNDPVFGPSPFKSGTTTVLVDQTAYVAPTYLTPVGTGSLAYVSPGAAAFLGSTPGWPGDFYVPTQAFLNANFGLPAEGISSLQLRLTNLNRAGNCTDEGWNVRFVQVDFDTAIPPVPEPATIALGAMALATAVTAKAIRRRGHQRASRPSESPWTTTLPAVSVAPRMGSSWHSWLTPYCSGASARPPSQKIA